MSDKTCVQPCAGCGTTGLHRHPDELCVACQLSDYYWALNHWQAAIWDQLREDEHEEARAYMIKDRAVLYELQRKYTAAQLCSDGRVCATEQRRD